MHPMGSYARLSREECRSRPAEAWSEQEWAPVPAVKDSLDATRLLNDEPGFAGWTPGTRRLPTKPATTDRMSLVEEPRPAGWHPSSCSQDSRGEEFEEL